MTHSLLDAVEKWISEVKALVRERVLPWYKEKGKEMGNTSLVDFSTACKRL